MRHKRYMVLYNGERVEFDDKKEAEMLAREHKSIQYMRGYLSWYILHDYNKTIIENCDESVARIEGTIEDRLFDSVEAEKEVLKLETSPVGQSNGYETREELPKEPEVVSVSHKKFEERDEVITSDDLVNLKIDLGLSKDVLDFIEKV